MAVLAQAVSCCGYDKPQKIMQHMHSNIPNMFECWADPVVHLLLLPKEVHVWAVYLPRTYFKDYYYIYRLDLIPSEGRNIFRS